VRLEGEAVWLTHQHMAELFQTTKQNVGQHLKKIFEEGELGEISVVKNFFTTAADGKCYATTYQFRKEEERYSKRILMKRISARNPPAEAAEWGVERGGR